MNANEFFPDLKKDSLRYHARKGRPLVTLSYAQSMDGSITHQRGEPLAISSPESIHYTHQLRDLHDAILVGIGTVLADDPRLTVRSLKGKDPQPVVLDSRLRIPMGARIWSHPCPPWIFSAPGTDPDKRASIVARGGAVYEIPSASGRFLALENLLMKLGDLGVRSLMVEGGASVITNFLSSGLVDRVMITIAPIFVGGLRLLEERLDGMPRLRGMRTTQVGPDIIVFGAFGEDADAG